MATEEDLEKAKEQAAADDADEAETAKARADQLSVRSSADSQADDAHDDGAAQPLQLGYKRYVYAAYMAGAMLVGFLVAKIGHVAWYRLGQWKPEVGEPQDELLLPIAGAIGIAVALYYWRRQDARQYADEVAEELSKVTWPSRKEVMSSTTVVVLTTIFATVFFALMDQFWKYVTDKIYSF